MPDLSALAQSLAAMTKPQLPGGSTGDPTMDQLGIGNATPQTPQAPESTPASPGGIKKYLSNFLYGFGESAKVQAGLPTDYEKQQAVIKNRIEQQKADANTDYLTGRNQATVTAANARANASTQNAVTKLQGTLAQHGYGIVQDAEGNITGTRPLKPEEMSGEALSNVQRNAAISEYQQAAAAAQRARADVLSNPNNPTFQQKERQIRAQLAMAQQKLNLAIAGNNRQDAQFQVNNGIKTDGSPAAIQGAGQLVGPNGETVGAKFAGNVAPTAQSKNMGQMAGTVIPHIQALRDDITKNADLLGPFSGRLSDAMINGFGSTGDPAKDRVLGKMSGDYKLITSAVARTHFGGKSGPQAVAYFNKLFDQAKTAEAAQGVLDSVLPYMEGYKEMGTPKTNLKGSAGFTFHPLKP